MLESPKVGVGGFAKSGPYTSDGSFGPSCLITGSPFLSTGGVGQAGSGCIKSEFGDTYE